MASLAQLLASHRRILVLDAASTRVQVGLLCPERDARWVTLDQEAGRALFAGSMELLDQGQLRLDDIDAFAFCAGPGSMLGIRTAAMTVRTWNALRPRPVFAYASLALAARHAWRLQPREFSVIADARRDSWHVQSIRRDGTLAQLRRLPAKELPAGEVLMPDHFRSWTAAPGVAKSCSYDVSEAMRETATDDLFADTAAPDAFQHEAPDYKKWSAQAHSAETARRR